MNEAQLKFRIASLQSQLSDKQKEVQDYRTIEQQADNKIKILNKVHADKVKSLLNSLQIVRKEKAEVENLTKQHKRSKLIEQLNKEILDQDLVIDVLRKQIYDQKGKEKGRQLCDDIIVKALKKGPERIRPETREELRIEIERLKLKQGLAQESNVKGKKGKAEDKDDDQSQISSVSSKSFVNQGEEILLRMKDLQKQNEDLRLQIATKGKIVEKLKAQGRQRDRLKAQTELLTNQLQVSKRRAETYQRLLRESKQNINGKVAELHIRQLRVEQLQLDSKENGQRLKQAHESTNILLQELKQEKEQLNLEFELLKKQNEDILLENITLKKRLEEQKNKINQVRDINNKNKEELSKKLKDQEQALQKLFQDYNQLQTTCRNLQTNLFRERGDWVQEKAKLIQQLEEKQVTQSKVEQDRKMVQEIDHLRKQNRDLKEIIESGTGGKTADNSILLQRLQNYRMKLQFYEKGESKGLYDELFNKYTKVLEEMQQLRKNAPKRKQKRKNIVEITKKDENDLQGLSSGISALRLGEIDSDILDNFDSDYSYELKMNPFGDKQFTFLPKMTQEDQQLLKLINSNLWQFVKDEQIDKKIEEIVNEIEVDSDVQIKKRIRELKNISHPKGKKVVLYDSQLKNFDNMSESVSITSALAKQMDNFDSDVDLQIKKNVKGAPNLNMRRIDALSDYESDSMNLSSAKSGESNLVRRKKGEKASVIKLSKDSFESQSNSKSNLINSDVSSMNVDESLLNGMNSDVSVDFRKRKAIKK